MNTAEGERFGAIEGGGTKFVCAVADARGRIVAHTRVATRAPRDTLAEVCGFFAPHALTSLGLACFGPLSLDPSAPDYGSMLGTPKPGWSNFPLRATLTDALRVPVAIDTDVNAAALAEQRWGALAGTRQAVYVTVGTGVGVGVSIDGRPLHGIMHPELGHLRSHDASFDGICPFHGGCVEGLASAPAIRARTGQEPHALADDHPVWTHVARTLGELLHAIVLAYAPERIVLGGGVLARAGLLARVRGELARSLGGYVPRATLAGEALDRYVVAPGLGEHSGLHGALALAGCRDAPEPR